MKSYVKSKQQPKLDQGKRFFFFFNDKKIVEKAGSIQETLKHLHGKAKEVKKHLVRKRQNPSSSWDEACQQVSCRVVYCNQYGWF
jgi:hypothetical protein